MKTWFLFGIWLVLFGLVIVISPKEIHIFSVFSIGFWFGRLSREFTK